MAIFLESIDKRRQSALASKRFIDIYVSRAETKKSIIIVDWRQSTAPCGMASPRLPSLASQPRFAAKSNGVIASLFRDADANFVACLRPALEDWPMAIEAQHRRVWYVENDNIDDFSQVSVNLGG